MASREAPRPVTKEDKSILRKLRKQGYDLSVTDLRNVERQIQEEQTSVVRGLTSYPITAEAVPTVNVEEVKGKDLIPFKQGRLLENLFSDQVGWDTFVKRNQARTPYKVTVNKDQPSEYSYPYTQFGDKVSPEQFVAESVKGIATDFATSADKVARGLGAKDTSALWTGGGLLASQAAFRAESSRGDKKGVKDDLLNAANLGSYFFGGARTIGTVAKVGSLAKNASRASILSKVPVPVVGLGAGGIGGGDFIKAARAAAKAQEESAIRGRRAVEEPGKIYPDATGGETMGVGLRRKSDRLLSLNAKGQEVPLHVGDTTGDFTSVRGTKTRNTEPYEVVLAPHEVNQGRWGTTMGIPFESSSQSKGLIRGKDYEKLSVADKAVEDQVTVLSRQVWGKARGLNEPPKRYKVQDYPTIEDVTEVITKGVKRYGKLTEAQIKALHKSISEYIDVTPGARWRIGDRQGLDVHHMEAYATSGAGLPEKLGPMPSSFNRYIGKKPVDVWYKEQVKNGVIDIWRDIAPDLIKSIESVM